MDIVTLAMAKPKVIALWDFPCESYYDSFNTAALVALNGCLSDGAVHTITAEDKDGALRKACSVGRNIIVRFGLDGNITESSANISRGEDGKVNQVSVYAVFLDGDNVLSSNFVIQFSNSTATKIVAVCKTL